VENYSSNLDQTTRKAALRAAPSQQDQAQVRLAQLSITAATLKNWLIKREAKLQDLKSQHALLEAEHARLQEQRYDEAEWLLGRAEHFERLVERRNVLISSLIVTIRAKSKANIALKAELDRLRKYKTSAWAPELKLLAPIEQPKSEDDEAKPIIERYQDATLSKKRLSKNHMRVKKLNYRGRTNAGSSAAVDLLIVGFVLFTGWIFVFALNLFVSH